MNEKILFIPDVHLTSTAPISRKETNVEYIQVQYDKLKFCYDYCVKNGINTIIYEGDIFNNSTSLEFSQLSDFISLVSSYKDKISSYSIVGNHDLYYRNMESNKTLLHLLFSAETIKPLTQLEFDTFRIIGVDYNKPIPAIENNDKYNICVAHCFYENDFFGGTGDTNLTEKQATLLGYDAYVLGHDHTYYPTIDTGEYRVVRPRFFNEGNIKNM